MKYSIIIPHINEWYLLDITLYSIYNQLKTDNYEIIIVDDWSDIKSELDFIYKHPLKDKIKLFFESNLWSSNARNFWASKAIWEYLIFIDSHMYFCDNFIEKVDYIIDKYQIKAFQSVIWSFIDKKLQWKIYKIKDFSLNSTWDDILVDSNNEIVETPNLAWWAFIIKNELFKKIDWFNKFLIKWWAEDLEISTRLWLYWEKCYLAKELFVAHYFKESFKNTTIDSKHVLNNKLMFAYTCFWKNIKILWKILNNLEKDYWEIFNETHKEVLNNKNFMIWKKNQNQKFIYDEDWYFSKFNIYYSFLENK